MKKFNKIIVMLLIALIAIQTLSAFTPSAKAAERFFMAEISPLTMYAGLSSTYTITITNIGGNSLGTANVTVPYGFTGVTTPTLATSSGVAWEVWFFSMNQISLKPIHPPKH
jgi:hypothetical protein